MQAGVDGYHTYLVAFSFSDSKILVICGCVTDTHDCDSGVKHHLLLEAKIAKKAVIIKYFKV